MEWLAAIAGLWVLFQWIIPIVILAVIAYAAYRWSQNRNREFAASEPDRDERLPPKR